MQQPQIDFVDDRVMTNVVQPCFFTVKQKSELLILSLNLDSLSVNLTNTMKTQNKLFKITEKKNNLSMSGF